MATITLELTPAHVEFLMLSLHRMACRGDEVVINVECRQILSRLHKQLASLEPAKAPPEGAPATPAAEPAAPPPRDAVSQALAALNGAKPEGDPVAVGHGPASGHTTAAEARADLGNRPSRRRREREAKKAAQGD